MHIHSTLCDHLKNEVLNIDNVWWRLDWKDETSHVENLCVGWEYVFEYNILTTICHVTSPSVYIMVLEGNFDWIIQFDKTDRYRTFGWVDSPADFYTEIPEFTSLHQEARHCPQSHLLNYEVMT